MSDHDDGVCSGIVSLFVSIIVVTRSSVVIGIQMFVKIRLSSQSV